jgi:hypothetical protein
MQHNPLLQLLEAELAFFESGGYGRPFRGSWRPTLLLRDSPTCFRAGLADGSEHCRNCKLWSLVPADRSQELIPCHHILLNDQGDTIQSLYRSGTQEALDHAYRGWLRKYVEQLKK